MTLANDLFVAEIVGGIILIFATIQLWPIISAEFYKYAKRQRELAEMRALETPKKSRLTTKMDREDEMADLNHRAERALATARAEVAETNLQIFRTQMAKHAELGETLVALPPTQNIDSLRNAKVPTLQQVEKNINAQGVNVAAEEDAAFKANGAGAVSNWRRDSYP